MLDDGRVAPSPIGRARRTGPSRAMLDPAERRARDPVRADLRRRSIGLRAPIGGFDAGVGWRRNTRRARAAGLGVCEGGNSPGVT